MKRRTLLVGLGSIVTGSGVVLQTNAYTSVSGDRDVTLDTTDGSNALVGIVGQGPVKKNAKEAMVEFTNNTGETVTVTTTLQTCTDGTLYNNQGDSGCSVTVTVMPGNARYVDIESAVTGAVNYSISVTSSSLSVTTDRTIQAESGNTFGAIRLQAPSKDDDFTAVRGNGQNSDEFRIKSVDVRDEDGDADLDRIEFEVEEGGTGGTVVGSLTIDSLPGDRYNPNGTPAAAFSPDAGYSITANTTYALTVTAYDADGNFESVTVEDQT